MPLSPSEKTELRAAIVADPGFLIEHILGWQVEWFHRLWLEWSVRHPLLLLEGPRGFGKSQVSTTGMVIWETLRDPDTRILIVSKTDKQAKAFVKRIREILETNDVLRQVFGEFVGSRTWRDEQLTVAQRTAIYDECTIESRGIGGQVVGTHWNRIYLDDLQDQDAAISETTPEHDWEWFAETLRPTLIPGGRIGVRATCYSWDDLRGRIERARGSTIYQAEDYRLGGGGPAPSAKWRVLKAPAILRDGSSLWESRFPLHDRVAESGEVTQGLMSIRDEDGAVFDRQYMQVLDAPAAKGEEETIYRREWFRAWTAAPTRAALTVYMRVDPAFRSAEDAAARTRRDRDPDFYAIGVVGFDRAAKRVYVLDAFRDRLTPLEREERSRELADRWQPDGIEIERTGLQVREAPSFYDRILVALRPHRARFAHPSGRNAGRSKVARAQPLATAMQRGEVEWDQALLDRYPIVDEFARFPCPGDRHYHDDLEDAIAGAYLMGERRSRSLAGHVRQSEHAEAGVPMTAGPRASARVVAPTRDPGSRVVGRDGYAGASSGRAVR